MKGSMIKSGTEKRYDGLLTDLSSLLEQARHAAARSVNAVMTATYWEIGRRIVEFEQRGEKRAEYGKELLKRLSKDLATRFGRGFSERNLELMRLFYVSWPISQTPSAKFTSSDLPIKEVQKFQTLSGRFPLPWSHYVRLLSLDDQAKRDFYEEEAQCAGWSVRQLDRQINSMLYERVAPNVIMLHLWSLKELSRRPK